MKKLKTEISKLKITGKKKAVVNPIVKKTDSSVFPQILVVISLISLTVFVAITFIATAKGFNGRKIVYITGQNSANNTNGLSTLDKLSRHIILPSGEQARLIIIENQDEYFTKNPNFFRYSKNGDKLFLYKKIAILYDENNDIILSVAPVVYSNSSSNNQITLPPDQEGQVAGVEFQDPSATDQIDATNQSPVEPSSTETTDTIPALPQ